MDAPRTETTHILVVEDDDALSMQLQNFLDSAGFRVTMAKCGKDAREILSQQEFDLVMLDWKLPDDEGPDICRSVRDAGKSVPILMLTAEAELDNKLHGFGCGADDYMTKPFSPRELLVRVKALLNRPPSVASDEFKFGILQFNSRSAEVFVDGAALKLLPKELALLEFFVRHPNQYFTPEQLLSNVWTADAAVGVATVRVQLNNLRKKLGTAAGLIQTSPGLGYKLAEPKGQPG